MRGNDATILSAAALAAVLACGTAASAQDQGTANPAPPALSEIIVTAQRRSENLQKVPISVTSIEQSMVNGMGAKSARDISILAPALTFDTNQTGALVSIRGVGGSGAVNDEPSNAVYVDGVYQSAPDALNFALFDIDRIEVLKGPQGTLFGRNSVGGVIQVITKRPSDDFHLDAEAGLANYLTHTEQLYVTGPIADGFNASLALYNQDQEHGWGRNLYDGSDIYKGYYRAAHGELLYKGGSRFTATLSLRASAGKAPSEAGNSTLPGEDPVPVPLGFYDGYYNSKTLDRNRSDQESLTLAYDFDHFKIVNILSNSSTYETFINDGDQTAAFIQQWYAKNITHAQTEEMQVLSPGSSKIKWVAGLFLYRSTDDIRPFRISSPGPDIEFDTGQLNRSIAAYGQTTLPIFAGFNLTLGGRYNVERKSMVSDLTIAGLGLIDSAHQAHDERVWTWKAGLDRQLGDNVLVYGSASKGFHGGLYNVLTPHDAPVLPETVIAYEVGAKMELFAHRLRLNLALFDNQFTNIQVKGVLPGGEGTLLNAARARIRGVDVDFQARPTRHLTLQGGVTYLDAKFTSYPDAQFFLPNPGGPGLVMATGDATGNRVPQSPKLVATLGFTYDIPTTFGAFTLGGSYNYNSGYFYDGQNRLRTPRRDILNASVSFAPPSKHWDMRLWANNITDKKYYSYMSPSENGDQYFPAPPRTFGFTLGVHY